ncbi:MAG: hypothetical protein Q8891_17005 [Bacteroidota bacterium]|nr:hypothetical protein [Bacteroidota bacterium]
MGIIRMGVPEDIALFIKESNKLNRFVETGTFHGDTSAWASQYFQFVDTIELSEMLYFKTKRRFDNVHNINLIFGDSRMELKKIIVNATEPILFWLDAHWCSGESYGEDDQCPLLEELNIINSSPFNNFILVDDARLFLAPPPLPNHIKFYPTINQIVNCLKNQFVSVFEDVLIIVPMNKQESFCDFLQEKTTKAWKDYGEQIKQFNKHKSLSRYSKTKLLLRDIIRIWNKR